jgi:Flp pilus assembly protein TadG
MNQQKSAMLRGPQNGRSSSRERGAATLVEFAVVSGVLLTLMFGVIDFSRAIYAYHFVSDAAREATRYASVRGSTCNTWISACPAANTDVTAYVQSIVSSGIYVSTVTTGAGAGTPGSLAVTTTWPGTTGKGAGNSCTTSQPSTQYPGCVVNVQVQYTYGFSLPYLKSLSKINMTSTSQFVISQ